MRRRALVVGTTGVLGAAAADYAARRRTARLIASDPELAVLDAPLSGRPQRIRSADGTTLYAEVFGREDAPTIVLIHGWTEAIPVWTYQLQALASDYRIVAFELRGHGRSDRAASGDYSLARFGDDVDAVLASCVRGGELAVLAGHSLGAMSIVAWAERHDVRLRARAARPAVHRRW